MRIAFYCTRGASCFVFTPRTIHERGVGGAELGLITIAEALAAEGHDVAVFNTCPSPGVYDGVVYARSDDLARLLGTEWDAFVLVRNPAPGDLMSQVRARRRIFFSCDQFTTGNYATDVFPKVDHTVAISPYHRDYLADRYGEPPSRITAVDLPVRIAEYEPELRLPHKTPHRLIYCSVPGRGLEHLARLFPRIRANQADAELIVTSDYSLWGEGIAAGNEPLRALFAGMPGVSFLGKVHRRELVRLQMSADILAYPNHPVSGNCELFGISVAECQVAGAVPVTSAYGAFTTTVIEGCLIGGDPSEPTYQSAFVHGILDLWSSRGRLTGHQTRLRAAALARFDPWRVAGLWTAVLRG